MRTQQIGIESMLLIKKPLPFRGGLAQALAGPRCLEHKVSLGSSFHYDFYKLSDRAGH